MQINRVYLPIVDSTNTWAKQNAEQFDLESLTVITAGEQTGGRGRFRRKWLSPAGCNLYVTYVFFLKTLPKEIGNLPQILSLAVFEALQGHAEAKIKWPNDLVIKKKKLGGILCEVTLVENQFAVVTGLGLNINMPKELLEQIDRPATSLMVELGIEQDLDFFSEKIHSIFHNYLIDFLQNGFSPFLDRFKKAIAHQVGDRLCFSNFENQIEGLFRKINEDGSLALELSDGTLKSYVSGEIL